MRTILLAVTLAILTSAATVKWMMPSNSSTNPATPIAESAYERIMRTGVIRCAYAPWAPYISVDPNTGALGGFNHDIFEAMAKELNLKVEWTEQVGYGNYAEGLKSGRYDVFCQTAWPDAGRLKNALTTIPAHYSKVNIVVRSDDTRVADNWQILNAPEYKVVVIDGDITDTIARNDFPKAQVVRLPQAADASQLFMEVATGKADATFVDYGFFQTYIQNNPDKLRIVGNVLRSYGGGFWVNNGELMLKALFDNTLLMLINNGQITRILQNYPTTAMSPAVTFQPRDER